MRIKACVFDLGDVLYDASRWRRWMHARLAEDGYAGSFADLVATWEGFLLPVYEGRTSYHHAFEAFLEFLFDDPADADRFREASLAEKRRIESQPRVVFPGVPATLEQLRSMGIQLAILSDNEAGASAIEAGLDRMGLGELFDAVLSSVDVGHAKPALQAFQGALLALGRSPEESLFIAHDQDELDGAAAAGMPTVAFETTGPVVGHRVLQAFPELVEFVGREEASRLEPTDAAVNG